MEIKLNKDDNLRVCGKSINKVWQDIIYEPDTESLKMPIYNNYGYKTYIYTENHENVHHTKGIIKIPINYLENRKNELLEKGFILEELDL